MVAELVLVLAFSFLGALLYSSVGHGGATIYLAILTLAGYAIPTLVTTVLVLNILVAGLAFLIFRHAGHLRARLLLPFIATSVPAAYLGGSVRFEGATQAWILAVVLTAAALRFLLLTNPPAWKVPDTGLPYYVGAPALGAALGFLAGATGIGGGIFLSPVLLMIGWANVRQAGPVAGAFIVLNSAAGLAAQLPRTPLDTALLFPMALVVLIGGALGALVGARRLPLPWLQRLLGIVLLAAAARALL